MSIPRESPDPSRPTGNTATGSVHGTLLQAHEVHGGVHVHTGVPVSPAADVSLDVPRPPSEVRGRAVLVGELVAAMRARAGQPHVLTGPGGIGKSTVAVAVAEKAMALGREVFWVRPGSVPASMLEAAVELGAPMGEAERYASSPRRAARWVWRHLEAADTPWLLVFDNVDRPEELDPDHRPGDGVGWLRASAKGFVLVTTRIDDPDVWAPSVLRRVEPLDSATSAAILGDYGGGPDAAGVDALAERLGGVPLALALAGRVRSAHRTMFGDFEAVRAHIAQSASRIDELARPLAREYGAGDPERATLAGTWRASMELMSDVPQAEPLLRLLSVLGADGVEVPLRRLPVELLRGGTSDPGEGSLDEPAVARALNALAVHGLVTVVDTREERALHVHPLIAETTRDDLGDRAAAVAEDVQRLLEAQPDRDLALEYAAYRALGEVRARALGADHPGTLETEVRRARLELLRGDAERAGSDLSAVAAAAERALGATHRVTLRARHHQGDALIVLDQLDEAEELFRSVLAVRESTLGADHPDTLNTRHQLALVAMKRGDWDAAEEGFRAVLHAKDSSGAGPDGDPGFVVQNLANVALKKGELDTAEQGFRQVLEHRERVLGAEHPETADARYDLALTALERGDVDKARDSLAAALKAWEKALGPDHPNTSRARERLTEVDG
ncbi:tetratricopeptide (TPR) repeat protein [Lipingzhangella halophila]|uniref:Tetratricopeptide (TPR) repeat protein n=1 Tax=Lipingzhangella halophila TaxID=1783352 RepID=A0A7W7RN40_9ACTN|nr:tetratricopeptide repeat protein [Lipingzhangella halophila]MBB4935029.1 tetratricopeptide (TPR) repeat protein [Lipingzhangella halophila]